MKGLIRSAPLALLLTTATAPAAEATLTAPQLAQCAAQVRQLREQSPQLLQLNAASGARRDALMQIGAALSAEGRQLSDTQLKAGLDYLERRKTHNQAVARFNGEVAVLRQNISALNVVKQDYDRSCSNRPYARSVFAQLPAEAQADMRRGLEGVQVPYLDQASLQALPTE